MNKTHKVMSLNSKARKIKVETHYSSPALSRTSSASEMNQDQIAEKVPARVPHPPSDVVLPSIPQGTDRLWVRLDNYDLKYVPLPKSGVERTAKPGKEKKKLASDSQAGSHSGSKGGSGNKAP